MKPVIIIFILLLSVTPLILSAETFSVYYGQDQTIENCSIESISDSTVVLRYKPDLPRLVQTKTIELASLRAIRTRSHVSMNASCLGALGLVSGVLFSATFIQSNVDGPLEGAWGWVESGYLKLGVIGLGGLVGGAGAYYGSQLLSGREGDPIILKDLPISEIRTILEDIHAP